MSDPGLHGIINIDKPNGMTSHDVVDRVRRVTGQRKVGHAGTLDPMATGVLLICLGQATRVAEYLMAGDKTYRARIRLGVTTDSYDAEGEVVHEGDTSHVTRSHVESELSGFVGLLEQVPPMYSAVKHGGTPLYRIARRGQTVKRRPRKVTIHEMELREWWPPDLEVKVRCSKGTYVRALAHELGQRLGCGAHLIGLIRTACGPFHIAQSTTLEDLERTVNEGQIARILQPLEAALNGFPVAVVDDETARRITLGQRVRLEDPPRTRLCRAKTLEGQVLALLRRGGDGMWQPHKVFVQPAEHENHPRPASRQPTA